MTKPLTDTQSVSNWDWDEEYDKLKVNELDMMLDQNRADEMRKEEAEKMLKQEEIKVENGIVKKDISSFFKKKAPTENVVITKPIIPEEAIPQQVMSEEVKEIADSIIANTVIENQTFVDDEVADTAKKRGRKPKATLSNEEAKQIVDKLAETKKEAFDAAKVVIKTIEKEKIGTPITRKETLEICDNIIETAEKERLDITAEEAKIGVNYDETTNNFGQIKDNYVDINPPNPPDSVKVAYPAKNEELLGSPDCKKTDNPSKEEEILRLAKAGLNVEPVNPIQRQIELSSYTKAQMTAEQKQELAEIKAKEVITNLGSIKEAMFDFDHVIDTGPKINVVEYEKILEQVRKIRPEPVKNPGPSEILESLEVTSRCIEYLSTPLGDLSRATKLLDYAIDNVKEMWTVVSTQGNDSQRKGEASIQLKDMIVRYNELNGLKISFENEMQTLKQQVFINQEQVKLLTLLANLKVDVGVKSGYEF